jgi:acetyl esterase/lipase
MLGDVKRAVAWIKANASRYGVDPDQIVLGGASAGGHLALLAAYTPQHPELTPEDLKNVDLSVCGIVSYYGPSDLLVSYRAWKLEQLVDQPPVPIGADPDHKLSVRDGGRIDALLGGHPQDVPHMYELASPVTHVRPGCPPTLLIQGKQDFVVPLAATRALYTKLVESGVPAMSVVYPWTDHGFDVVVPQINPAAQSALYDVDRFLALLVSKDRGQ